MKDWLTIRNGIGIAVLVLFFRTATSGLAGYGGFGPAILSMAYLVLAGILFSKSLSGWVSIPFTTLIDAIYFGNNQAEPPPVTLKLARIYRHEKRHADAIGECERQLEFHPRSLELWTELIRSTQESGDEDSARKLHRKALRRLKGEDRERLERDLSRGGSWAGYGEWKALR